MKYIDEYREPERVRYWIDKIHAITTKPWTLMEVCGGQTHAIMKFGLQELLPRAIRLIHGPGCPVCVTPISLVDHALHIARSRNTILCTFGDMMRVPGTRDNLLSLKAKGHDVRMVHSPLEALSIARKHPTKEVVFFGVGFETTAPANALTVFQAQQQKVQNFSLLSAHVLVPAALQFLVSQPDAEIQGFLAAGHVCTVTGYQEYHKIAQKYPIVITGFEPVDVLQGIYAAILQLEHTTSRVENKYSRCVQERGNLHALDMMKTIFYTVDREWRGIGIIPNSGLDLLPTFQEQNAQIRFPYNPQGICSSHCISGEVLQGKKRPSDCPCFQTSCTPETPQGAPMVSSEGACSAYFHWSTRCPAQHH